MEFTRVEKLKEDALRLFELKDDAKEYEKNARDIADKVHDLKLEHIIDSGELLFFLKNPVKEKKLSTMDEDEFQKAVDHYLKIKVVDFYFQISELSNFPTPYTLGFGLLLPFNQLPNQVQNCAQNLSKGIVPNTSKSFQKMWSQILKTLTIPADPKTGHWLKISVSGISSIKNLDRAFEHAEESLDILRMAVSTARFHLPRFAIAINLDTNRAYPVARGVEISRYPYNKRHQSIIDLLNSIYRNPSSELHNRIKNAIQLYRIADNNSPNHHKIFFYIAAIEHLILGSNDRDVLRWKLSEKGAILLSNNLGKRLSLTKELKKMYDNRSKIAHGGEADYDFFLTTSSRYHMRKIVMELMNLIKTQGLKTITKKGNKPRQSLDEYLDDIIYSG